MECRYLVKRPSPCPKRCACHLSLMTSRIAGVVTRDRACMLLPRTRSPNPLSRGRQRHAPGTNAMAPPCRPAQSRMGVHEEKITRKRRTLTSPTPTTPFDEIHRVESHTARRQNCHYAPPPPPGIPFVSLPGGARCYLLCAAAHGLTPIGVNYNVRGPAMREGNAESPTSLLGARRRVGAGAMGAF